MEYLTNEIPVWAVLLVAGVQAAILGAVVAVAAYKGKRLMDAKDLQLRGLVSVGENWTRSER